MDAKRPQLDRLSEKAIRRVFRDWGSLKALGSHPLASLEIVKARHQVAGYTQTPTGCGLALREVLQAVLETLKPNGGSPEPEEKNWRSYIILDEQYVHGRSPEWVTEQLHVSKGTYYSEQKRAFERVADRLQQWEEEHHRLQEREPTPALFQVPFLAPPRQAHTLVGRDNLLRELKQRLLIAKDTAQLTLYGLPGVGKTALALALAHDAKIRAHFADGILWAGLGRQPDVLTLLGIWAAAVGIPIAAIAKLASLADRAAAIHAAIGLRRMLLVIDDAWQLDAALAFKLGGPNCAHLLTTRLTNIALDFAGEEVIKVQELNLAQGLNLLAQLSPRAVEAEPAEAEALVQSVGGLPLALILMGNYLRKQSYAGQARRLHEALAGLQAVEMRLQLAQPQSPLEPHTNPSLDTPLSLQASIGLNDAALDKTAHQALLDLSLFPPKPNTFAEAAALAVIAAPVSVLDTLVDHGLVESLASDRYTMHQTIADYASLQGASPPATERWVRYFVQLLENYASQHEVLEQDFNNILTALSAAYDLKLPDLFIRGVNTFHPFLETRGLYQLDAQLLRQAHTVAEASRDPVALATLLYNIGDLDVKLGQFREAQTYFQQSITLAQATRSRQLEAKGLLDLGLACWYLGGKLEDRNYFERALQLFQELGDSSGQGYALNGLGFASVEMGDFNQARAYLEQALRVCRESGNRRGEGWAYYNLGTVYLPLGDFTQARAHWAQGLQIYQEIHDRRGEAWLIYNLGRLHRHTGQYDRASSSFEQALHMFNELGDRFGQGWASHNLGLVYSEMGDDATATTHLEQAMHRFLQIGCRTGEHQTYHSLGVMLRRRGDYGGARIYLERALNFRQKTGYIRGEGKTLAHLGLVHHYLGETGMALRYCQQALRIAQEIGACLNQAQALTCLGHVLSGIGHLDEAADSYRQAMALRCELGQPHLVLDAQAGLARVLLVQGELLPAQAEVERILEYLAPKGSATGLESNLAGVDDPGQIFLTCYNVLQASQDSRAQAVLRAAHQYLQERAVKIGDEAQQHLFWEQVTVHQEIAKAY